jgi:hypothetical protein
LRVVRSRSPIKAKSKEPSLPSSISCWRISVACPKRPSICDVSNVWQYFRNICHRLYLLHFGSCSTVLSEVPFSSFFLAFSSHLGQFERQLRSQITKRKHFNRDRISRCRQIDKCRPKDTQADGALHCLTPVCKKFPSHYSSPRLRAAYYHHIAAATQGAHQKRRMCNTAR